MHTYPVITYVTNNEDYKSWIHVVPLLTYGIARSIFLQGALIQFLTASERIFRMLYNVHQGTTVTTVSTFRARN